MLIYAALTHTHTRSITGKQQMRQKQQARPQVHVLTPKATILLKHIQYQNKTRTHARVLFGY